MMRKNLILNRLMIGRLLICFLLLIFVGCEESKETHDKVNVIEDYCRGKIVRTEHNYFIINLDYYKAEKCFVWSINKPYLVEKNGKEIRYKLLPPFRVVMYKSLKMAWAPKVFPSSKPFYLKGIDSLWFPLNRNLNIFGDSVFWTESGFANLKSVNVGDSLILEIPCVDEDYAKEVPVFQIGQTEVPVIECKIDPVDRDYPVYLDSMDIW